MEENQFYLVSIVLALLFGIIFSSLIWLKHFGVIR